MNQFTNCHECDRGGRGNATDKCSCGWRIAAPSNLGCYLGTPIVGKPVEPPKLSRAQQRYRRYLRFSECFASFRDFLSWDGAPERSWNGGVE